MMRSVFTKSLYDRRWFIFGWSLAFLGLTVLLSSFYPAMKVSGLDQLVANMPPAFKGLIGDLSLLNAFDTYIASQLFDIRLPLIAGIMAIILGLGLGSNEEEQGELRTYLALPISRSKLVIQKWLVIAIVSLAMVAAIGIGVIGSALFVPDATITAGQLLPELAMSWLLMMTFGTIVYGSATISGRRSAAMAAGVIIVIGSFILSTFGSAVSWLADYEKLSLLYYFPANNIIKSGLDWFDVAVLGIITVVFITTATIVFRRRDVK